MPNYAILDSNNFVVGMVNSDPSDLPSITYHFDKNFYSIKEYSIDDQSITNNKAELFYTYYSDANAFLDQKPDPTYIINTETYEWEPDPTLEYDLDGDGCMCRYNPETKTWTPCFNAPEPE